MTVPTPCIGLCSTTFGDLVCRGCKRYIHEIVGWNGFTDAQKRIVVLRLEQLRIEAVRAHAAVTDAARLAQVAMSLRLPADQPVDLRAFEVLRRTAHRWRTLEEIGCRANVAGTDPVTARNLMDEEFLGRAHAHYEHDFRVLLSGQ